MINKILIALLLTCNFVFGQNLTDSKGKKQGAWSKTYRILEYYNTKVNLKMINLLERLLIII